MTTSAHGCATSFPAYDVTSRRWSGSSRSAPTPTRAGEVQRSAEAVRDLFAAEGFECQITSADGGRPAVIAHKRSAHEGAPTILLYAHHDVQPENDHADWDSPPFEPTERATAGASTPAVPPTTRPGSPPTSAPCGSTATTSRSTS